MDITLNIISEFINKHQINKFSFGKDKYLPKETCTTKYKNFATFYHWESYGDNHIKTPLMSGFKLHPCLYLPSKMQVG